MGIKDTLILLQWFQILPYKIDANELLFGTPQNPIISEGNINHLMPWASNIETKLGYRFNNRGYLLQVINILQQLSVLFLVDCYIEFFNTKI